MRFEKVDGKFFCCCCSEHDNICSDFLLKCFASVLALLPLLLFFAEFFFLYKRQWNTNNIECQICKCYGFLGLIRMEWSGLFEFGNSFLVNCLTTCWIFFLVHMFKVSHRTEWTSIDLTKGENSNEFQSFWLTKRQISPTIDVRNRKLNSLTSIFS